MKLSNIAISHVKYGIYLEATTILTIDTLKLSQISDIGVYLLKNSNLKLSNIQFSENVTKHFFIDDTSTYTVL